MATTGQIIRDEDPFGEATQDTGTSQIIRDDDPFGEVSPRKTQKGPERKGRLLKALGFGVAQGVTTELPSLAGGAAEFVGAKTGIQPLEDYGRAVKEWGEEKGKEWFGDPTEWDGLEKIVYEGSKMLAPSLIPAGLVTWGFRALKGLQTTVTAAKLATKTAKTVEEVAQAGALWGQATKVAEMANKLGAGSAGVLFGLSQAQSTIDSANATADALEAEGKFEEAAAARAAGQGWAPYLTGAIEATGEYFGTKYLEKLFGLGPVKKIVKDAVTGTSKVVMEVGGKRTAKAIAADFLKTLGVEIGTEIGQAAGEAGVEKYTGVRPTASPWQEALDVIGPTAFMTLLTGGLAGAVNRIKDREKDASDQPLTDTGTGAKDISEGQLSEDKDLEDFREGIRKEVQGAVEGIMKPEPPTPAPATEPPPGEPEPPPAAGEPPAPQVPPVTPPGPMTPPAPPAPATPPAPVPGQLPGPGTPPVQPPVTPPVLPEPPVVEEPDIDKSADEINKLFGGKGEVPRGIQPKSPEPAQSEEPFFEGTNYKIHEKKGKKKTFYTFELTDDAKESLELAQERSRAGDPGRRLFIDKPEVGEGGGKDVIGAESTYPEFFKGRAAKKILNAIQKALEGKRLEKAQMEMVSDAIDWANDFSEQENKAWKAGEEPQGEEEPKKEAQPPGPGDLKLLQEWYPGVDLTQYTNEELKGMFGAALDGAPKLPEKGQTNLLKKEDEEGFKLTPSEPTPEEEIQAKKEKGEIKAPEKGEKPGNVFPDGKIPAPTTGKQRDIFGRKKEKKGQTLDLEDLIEEKKKPVLAKDTTAGEEGNMVWEDKDGQLYESGRLGSPTHAALPEELGLSFDDVARTGIRNDKGEIEWSGKTPPSAGGEIKREEVTPKAETPEPTPKKELTRAEKMKQRLREKAAEKKAPDPDGAAAEINKLFEKSSTVVGELDPEMYGKVKAILDREWKKAQAAKWSDEKFVDMYYERLGDQAVPYFEKWIDETIGKEEEGKPSDKLDAFDGDGYLVIPRAEDWEGVTTIGAFLAKMKKQGGSFSLPDGLLDEVDNLNVDRLGFFVTKDDKEIDLIKSAGAELKRVKLDKSDGAKHLVTIDDNIILLLPKSVQEIKEEKGEKAEEGVDTGLGEGGPPGGRAPAPATGGETPGRGRPKGVRPGLRVASEELLPRPPDKIPAGQYEVLGPEQRFAVNLALDAFDRGKKGFLLADGTGVGKTMQILVIAKETAKKTGKPSLIITQNEQIIKGNFQVDAKTLGIDLQTPRGPTPAFQKAIDKKDAPAFKALLNLPDVLSVTFNKNGEIEISVTKSKDTATWKQIQGQGFEISHLTVSGADAKVVITSDIEIGTYDSLRIGKIGKGKQYGVVLFDEAHNLKNVDAAKTMAADAVLADHRLFATATPMDRPTGASYFLSQITGIPQETVQMKLGFSVREVFDALTGQTRKYASLREGHTWEDVMDNLVEMRNRAIQDGTMIRREYPFYGDVSTKTKTLSATLHEDEKKIIRYWDNRIASARSREAKRNLSGQKTLELSRWLEAKKVDWVYGLIQADLKAGKHVVVVAEGINETIIKGLGEMVPGFIGALEKRAQADNTDFAKIYGTGNKAKEVDRFQKGAVKLAVATPKSGGAGINLDDTLGDKPRKVYIVTPNFAGDVFQQILGRFSRRNTASPAEVHFVFYSDAFSDQRRMSVAEKKMETLRAIQEGQDLDTAYGFEETGEQGEDKDKGPMLFDKEGGERAPPEKKVTTEPKPQPPDIQKAREAVKAAPIAFIDEYEQALLDKIEKGEEPKVTVPEGKRERIHNVFWLSYKSQQGYSGTTKEGDKVGQTIHMLAETATGPKTYTVERPYGLMMYDTGTGEFTVAVMGEPTGKSPLDRILGESYIKAEGGKNLVQYVLDVFENKPGMDLEEFKANVFKYGRDNIEEAANYLMSKGMSDEFAPAIRQKAVLYSRYLMRWAKDAPFEASRTVIKAPFFDVEKKQTLEIIKKDVLNQNVERTIVNELLQNSLDAFESEYGREVSVRLQHEWDKGEMKLKPGEVAVHWSDNGSGMLPEVVKEAFLKVGNVGTKTGKSRGGYGFAKTFLLACERIKLVTVSKESDGRLIESSLEATRDELYSPKKMDIGVENDPSQFHTREGGGGWTGTTLSMVFDETDFQVWKFEEELIKYREALRTPITIRAEGWGSATRASGSARTHSQRDQLHPSVVVKHKGSVVRIYFEKAEWIGYDFSHGPYHINNTTLNKGLPLQLGEHIYGFEDLIFKPDFAIRVDFEETPETKSKNYPFLKNRTEILRDIAAKVKEAADKRINDINLKHYQKEVKGFKGMLDGAPEIEGIKILIPFKDQADVEKATKVMNANREVFSDIAKIYNKFKKMMSGIAEKEPNLCVILDPKVHGIRSNPDAVGVEVNAINPFSVTKKFLEEPFFNDFLASGDRDITLLKASNFVHTLVHEFTHNIAKTSGRDPHGELFTHPLGLAYAKLSHIRLAQLEEDLYGFYERHSDRIERIEADLRDLGKGGSKFSTNSATLSPWYLDAERERLLREDSAYLGRDRDGRAVNNVWDGSIVSPILNRIFHNAPTTGASVTRDLEADRTFVMKLFEMVDPAVMKVGVQVQKLQRQVQKLAGKPSRKKFYFGIGYQPKYKRSQHSDDLDRAMYFWRDTGGDVTRIRGFRTEARRLLGTNISNERKIYLKKTLRILDIAENLTPEQRDFALYMGDLFDDAARLANQHGLLRTFVSNYVRRIYNLPEEKRKMMEGLAGGSAHGFSTFFSPGLPRTYTTTLDAILDGYEIAVSGITNSYSAYMTELVKVVSNKAFIHKGMNTVDAAGNKLFTTNQKSTHRGFKKLEASGFQVWTWAGEIEAEKDVPDDEVLTVDTYGRKFFATPPENIPEAWAVYAPGAAKAKLFDNEYDANAYAQAKGYTRIDHRRAKEQSELFEKVPLYAPGPLADMINKATAKDSLFWQTPALETVKRLNSGIKSWILMSSFFHHMAGARSWVFGVHHGWKKANPIRAYKDGLKKIEDLHPLVTLGVKNGLTLGEIQDWSEYSLSANKGLTEKLLTHFGLEKPLKTLEYFKFKREQWADSLFKRFFAGLKAEGFAIEYAHELQKATNAYSRGLTQRAPDINKIAERVALLINEDFGGLHLKRMGRNPTLQNISRLILLAPDWTESNFRIVTGMIPGLNEVIGKAVNDIKPPPEMTPLYRKFMGRAYLRIAVMTIIAQMLLNGSDDTDEYLQEQMLSNRWNKLRWTEVDVTKLYHMLGVDTEGQKKTFSIGGHFFDPLKLIDPVKLIKGKGSPFVRVMDAGFTGSDWAERPFTGATELLTTGKTVKKSVHQEKEGFFSRLPATVVNQVVNMQPIQMGHAIKYLQGEEDALTALLTSAGAAMHTAWKPRLETPISAPKGGDDASMAAVRETMKNESFRTRKPPSRYVQIKQKTYRMSRDQYDRYLEESSERVRKRLNGAIGNGIWETWSDETKAKKLTSMINNSRKKTRDKIEREMRREIKEGKLEPLRHEAS